MHSLANALIEQALFNGLTQPNTCEQTPDSYSKFYAYQNVHLIYSAFFLAQPCNNKKMEYDPGSLSDLHPATKKFRSSGLYVLKRLAHLLRHHNLHFKLIQL